MLVKEKHVNILFKAAITITIPTKLELLMQQNFTTIIRKNLYRFSPSLTLVFSPTIVLLYTTSNGIFFYFFLFEPLIFLHILKTFDVDF